MKKLILGIMCLFAFMGSANAGVIYNMQNGKLLSVNGVNINGLLYNVTFGNSCNSMFAGCNASLLDFNTQADAISAMDALFSQVFLDNVLVDGNTYNFDANPELVQSCDVVGFCEIWIPYNVANGNATSVWYVNVNGNDYVGSVDYNIYTGYGDSEQYMAFTNFELATNTVPSPMPLSLLGLGLLALVMTRKKQSA